MILKTVLLIIGGSIVFLLLIDLLSSIFSGVPTVLGILFDFKYYYYKNKYIAKKQEEIISIEDIIALDLDTNFRYFFKYTIKKILVTFNELNVGLKHSIMKKGRILFEYDNIYLVYRNNKINVASLRYDPVYNKNTILISFLEQEFNKDFKDFYSKYKLYCEVE